MTEISIRKIREINQFWLVYARDEGDGHIQLSACANNFRIHHGCDDGDGLQCVGLRYEKDGFGCYELFNVGHLVLCTPLRPGILQQLAYRLQGKDPEEAHRKTLEAFEDALKVGGWMTLPRPDKA